MLMSTMRNKIDSKVFQRAILQEPVCRFLDWQKVFASREFTDLVTHQIDHCRTHRDTTALLAMLTAVQQQKGALGLLQWYCDACNLDYDWNQNRLVLRQAAKPRHVRGDWVWYRRHYPQNLEHLPRRKQNTPQQTRGRHQPNESGVFDRFPTSLERTPAEYQAAIYRRKLREEEQRRARRERRNPDKRKKGRNGDPLDSWRRLPGSYGSNSR